MRRYTDTDRCIVNLFGQPFTTTIHTLHTAMHTLCNTCADWVSQRHEDMRCHSKIGSAFIAHPHWVHNFMPYIWYGSSYLLLSYVFLKKSNAFCDLNFKLIMYLPNPVSCWRILFVCKCVCGTMWVCLSADGSFRRVGHRAMYLQLPPLCALFDGEKDGVYF